MHKQHKERGGLRLSSAVPKIQWASITPAAPTAIRLWELFHFLCLVDSSDEQLGLVHYQSEGYPIRFRVCFVFSIFIYCK